MTGKGRLLKRSSVTLTPYLVANYFRLMTRLGFENCIKRYFISITKLLSTDWPSFLHWNLLKGTCLLSLFSKGLSLRRGRSWLILMATSQFYWTRSLLKMSFHLASHFTTLFIISFKKNFPEIEGCTLSFKSRSLKYFTSPRWLRNSRNSGITPRPQRQLVSKK